MKRKKIKHELSEVKNILRYLMHFFVAIFAIVFFFFILIFGTLTLYGYFN